MDASRRYIQIELANANTHALNAEVTQTQYTATICDAYDVDIFAGPIVHHCVEFRQVLGGKVHSTGPDVTMQPQIRPLAYHHEETR